MIQVDRQVVIQVLGSLMERPDLLNNIDKYRLEPNDFPLQLDKFIFSAIYNLYVGGAEKIHTVDIDSYLKTNDVARNLIEKENGLQFIQDCETYGDVANFNFYYNKLKKINLIRELSRAGHDVSKIYCDDPLNENYNKINERFETLTTNDIINELKGELASLENKYVLNSVVEETRPTDGLRELIKDLQTVPEVGVRLQGDIFNTITRGGRKGKLYLRSAASGVGKSRTMVGDACKIAYPVRYEPSYGQWIGTGRTEKVLYVMTEQDPSEIQTMILAYLTGYNEEMFLYGTFTEKHMDRIMKAVEIMEKYKDNFLFARIPDPCASVVKNLFRKYNIQFNVENFFYDYIFSSPAMLEEYRDLKLPEHVCLRLFTTALKNLAVELNAFILTSTQISETEDNKKSSWKDHHNISGSRAIVHLVDVGCIMSRPTLEELSQISGFQKIYNLTPNLVTDFYKNRRGRWTMVRVWSYVDLGTCKKYDLFVTTPDLKPIEDFQIVDFIENNSNEDTEIVKKLNENSDFKVITTDDLSNIIENQSQNNIFESIVQAFGNEQQTRERLKNLSFEELV